LPISSEDVAARNRLYSRAAVPKTALPVVKSVLSVLVEGRTTLIIAHRPSMLTDVDRVLVLQNGRIEQNGTSGQLMKVDGYFRDMMFRRDEPLTRSA
jgi:ABC-type multidrug transport system fused ATPase/permease subunit